MDRAFIMLNVEKDVMVDTVKTNQEGFTDRDYEHAKRAQKMMGLVRYPSPKDFKNMVYSNMIKNFPVASTYIANANTISGTDLATLKGNTVRITPLPVMTDYVQIPKEIVCLNHNMALEIDIMFVNSLPFMVSVSCKVKFTTAEYLLG
jgi:hypothetical protein